MALDILQTLGLGGSQGSAAGPGMGAVAMQTFILFGKTLIFIIPIIILAFFIWRYKKFPVNVIFFRKRGRNVAIDKDKAGRVKERGVWKYKFMKFKNRALRMEPPELEDIYFGPKGNHLFLFETDAGVFSPIKLCRTSNPGVALTPISKSVQFWEQMEIRDAIHRFEKPNPWMQYMPVIGLATMGVFIVIMLVLVKGDLSATAQVVSNALIKTAEMVGGSGGGSVAPGY